MSHYVCLTFDIDHTSASIAKQQTSPMALSRANFGVAGTRRILALLQRENIQSTWFAPGHTIESYPACMEAVLQGGHEVAAHGWTHRLPTQMDRETEERELIRSKEAIRRLVGSYPLGYRSPAWDMSEHTIELLIEQGFEYDSSLMGHDYLPYQARRPDSVPLEGRVVFGEDTPLVEMPVSWSLVDTTAFEHLRMPTFFYQGLMNISDVLENWLEDFRYLAANMPWGILTYTFHPQVIARGHRMVMLERLVTGLQENGAKFVTQLEAVGLYRKRYPNGRSELDPESFS